MAIRITRPGPQTSLSVRLDATYRTSRDELSLPWNPDSVVDPRTGVTYMRVEVCGNTRAGASRCFGFEGVRGVADGEALSSG